MKKTTTLITSCLLAMISFSVMAVTTSDFVIDEGVLIGDVNCDSHLTSADVTAIYDYLLNGDQTYYNTCDVDGDGHVTSADVTAVYDLLLNGGGHVGGSVIKMSDFVPNSLTNYNSEDYQHQWVDGDVIFIAVDPDYSSSEACQNVYAMVRTGGKWVLQDVQGSNKQGFKTVGGTICAVYVQHADLSKSYYDYIPLTGDVACVNSAANYTVTPKNGKFYIKINDIILHHFVSRIDVNGAYQGDYFYESVTHLDALTKIMWQPLYTYSAFETSGKAPVIDIDNSTHKGYAYGVWRKDTYANGWLTFNYAKYNGYSFLWPYSQNALNQGRSLSIDSPWKVTWNRDLSMRYYNYDERKSYRLNAGSTYQDVEINVGTNIIFRPWDGDRTDSQGTMTSVTVTKNGITDNSILDISYDNTQVSVTAHKVGLVTLTIKFKTKDNITTIYTYYVRVNPTVWAVGATSDKKPILWRNWQDKSMYLNDKEAYTSANEVIVRGNNAYVMMRKDIANSNTGYYSGTAGIYKNTVAHGGGYYNKYKDGLTGASKMHYKDVKNNMYSYIAGIPHLWVDKNNNVYHTTAYRENSTDDFECIVSTDIYKNKSFLRKNSTQLINDIATDDSGNLYYVGYYSNLQQYNDFFAVTYPYLGKATSYFAKLTSSNSLSLTSWEHYVFNRLFVKNNIVYVDAYGFYEDNEGYTAFYYTFGKNVFLRYISSLELYTGQVAPGGLSMLGSNYNTSGTLINPGQFLLEGNKFYYSGGIRTYQLGASETVSYTAYPNGTSPINFDVKNGMIGIVLSEGSSNPRKVMACELNAFYSGPAMENSTGASIYDVWLQTSLDD